MILSIASGKGGTGKTTVAVNLALSLGAVRLIDCDVEEPNCHIFLKPEVGAREDVCIMVPHRDESLCDNCGKCADFCRFNALAVSSGIFMSFPELCHGCGGCILVCPNGALTEEPRSIGEILHGSCGDISVSWGLLNIGEAMATPLIAQLKNKMDPLQDTILDAPPGTSCAAIGAVIESDFCILVTEPTPFGLNDLTLAVEMLESLSVPHGVIINRDGIGDDKVEEYCERKGIPILLRIPHDERIALLYSEGMPFVDDMPEYRTMFADMMSAIREMITK